MIISDKQVMQLMEAARLITLNENYPQGLRTKMEDLIYDINHQQSSELKETE